MNQKELLLASMKTALEGSSLEWNQEATVQEWQEFFRMAEQQKVLPVVFESVRTSESFQKTATGLVPMLKAMIMQSVFIQINKTQEFLKLYQYLVSRGLEPIVVKGIILRNLYPSYDARVSGDEDLFIPEESYQAYKEALEAYGMILSPADEEIEDISNELLYQNPNGTLQVEIHKSLFDSKLSAFKGMNDLFDSAFENTITIEVEGQKIRTMNHNDHMLFLVLHAFQHFISSGFGIRQVCDMVIYVNEYGKEIDWDHFLEQCRNINADKFAAAIFEIGHRYLGFDYEQSRYSKKWQEIKVDPNHLLKDLFEAGIHGHSSMNRTHSATMTLTAVSANKEGKKQTQGLLRTIFPPLRILEKKYSYLKKYPFLLTFAWMVRIAEYVKASTRREQNLNAAESIQIGNNRVELLREYGIIR